MPNPLINSVGGNQARTPAQAQNPMQFLGDFMKNPVSALRQAGFNVPDGMNNPQQIVNHLISNGQLSNGRLAQIQNMARLIGKR